MAGSTVRVCGVDPGCPMVAAVEVDVPCIGSAHIVHSLLNGEWVLRGMHFMGSAVKGTRQEYMDAVRHDITPVFRRAAALAIETQPGGIGHLSTREMATMLRTLGAAAFPDAHTLMQGGSVKNRLVDAVLLAWPDVAGAVVHKVPRKCEWRVVMPGGGLRVQGCGFLARVIVEGHTPPDPFFQPEHGALVDAQGAHPARARRQGAAQSTSAYARDAARRVNKKCAMEVVLGILAHRTVCGRRDAQDALVCLTCMPPQHRHDVCDALLHALAPWVLGSGPWDGVPPPAPPAAYADITLPHAAAARGTVLDDDSDDPHTTGPDTSSMIQ